MKAPVSVLIRCDGSPTLGMGHLSRCRVLADSLLSDHACRVFFSVREEGAQRRLEGLGHAVFPGREGDGCSYGTWLREAARWSDAGALVLDVRDDPPLDTLKALKEAGLVLATIDDASPTRLLADLAFYPPAPQTARLDWEGFSGSLHQGWEWVVVDRRFCRTAESPLQDPPVVLVTMGGSDPAGLTRKAVRALDRVGEGFQAWIVLGPYFSGRDELEALLDGCRWRFRIFQDAGDMPSLMARADLAVASFGVTAFELAAAGVPALHLCLSADHAGSASTLTEAGIAISLGFHEQVPVDRLARAISGLLHDREKRRGMGARARAHVDGEGAQRIGRTIVERVRSQA